VLILIVGVVVFPLMFRYACGSSNNPNTDSTTIAWGSGIEAWEWCALYVIWFGVLGTIFRLLPMVSGRPSALESSQKCTLDGVAALGVCSPFSSEDDAILLRSLLGRTCTAFHTVGSRHSIHGLYVDTILNERRVKGEANRRNCWIAWMKFLSALVDVSLLMKEEGAQAAAVSALSDSTKAPEEHQPADKPGRPLYVRGTVDAHGVPKAVSRTRRTSIASSERRLSLSASSQLSFKDIGASLHSTQGVTEGQRNHLTAWSRDQIGSRPLIYGMMTAVPVPARPADASIVSFSGRDDLVRPIRRVLSKITEASSTSQGSHAQDNLQSWSCRSVDTPSTGVSGNSSQFSLRYDQIYPREWSSRDPEPRAEDVYEVTPGSSSSGGFHTPCTGTRSSADFSVPYERIYGNNFTDSDESHELEADLEPAVVDAPQTSATTMTWSTRSARMVYTAARQLASVFTDADNAPQSPLTDDQGPMSPAENQIRSPAPAARFPVNRSKKPRAMTDRQHQMASSYLRPHGIPNLQLDMADILPMIDFLDAWLEEMKENEWTYDYRNPK
jgi:hypothetical protein